MFIMRIWAKPVLGSFLQDDRSLSEVGGGDAGLEVARNAEALDAQVAADEAHASDFRVSWPFGNLGSPFAKKTRPTMETSFKP